MKNIFKVLLIVLFFSCSSAPKRPLEIDNIRKQAELELTLGNSAAAQGKYENALLYLTEAKRKAASVDDPSLIIRTCIARGNVLLSVNRTGEAFAEFDAAVAEAERTRFANRELLAAARVFYARALLLSGRDSAENALAVVDGERGNIKDPYYAAFAWQTRGLCLRAMEFYAEAEASVKRGLDIHEKNRYLENASNDWYIIASIRSLAGNYAGALLALEESLSIDRRIENSRGLAASWNAIGDVYSKMGNENEAAAARARAKTILNSIN